MSQHSKEPWVVHLFEGGGFVINTSTDVDESPVICARNDWSNRARESHDNAIRIGQSINACAGLTPEQIAAIPRLVAWFTDAGRLPADEAEREESAILAIFSREALRCGSSSSNC